MKAGVLLFFAVLVAFLGCAQANAATELDLHSSRTIHSIGAYANRGYIRFTPAASGVEGCAVQDHVVFEWSTDPDVKTLYATALAAFSAGRNLVVAVAGCSSTGVPVVYRVDILP